MPQVTFIIPAHNAASYLRQAVGSVLGQSVSDWRLIIVDDGSSDDTGRIADSFAATDPRISCIHHPLPSGSAYQARRTAILAADTPVIAPLDADDHIPPDYLHDLLKARGESGAPAVYPLIYICRGRNSRPFIDPSSSYLDTPISGREAFPLTLNGWKVTCNGGLIDRDLYIRAMHAVGDSQNDSNSDETLTRQILLMAPTVLFTTVKYFYRVNPDSVTHRVSVRRLEILRSASDTLDLALSEYPWDSEEVALARLNMFNTVFDSMEIIIDSRFEDSDRRLAISMIEETKNRVDLKIMKGRVNPLLYRLFTMEVARAIPLFAVYRKIRGYHKLLTSQLRRPARKYRHLRDLARHRASLHGELKWLRKGATAPGSESWQFLERHYSSTDASKEGNTGDIVICPFDGRIYHGGTTDRIRGLLSTFAETEKRGIPFRISWTSPFNLEDYLQPADYDWRIRPEEISDSQSDAMPVIIQDRSNPESAAMLAAALDGIHGQLHVYSNADCYIGSYSRLYRRLFRPSPRLARSVLNHKRVLGDRYWAFHFRFLTLLGDFKDWSDRILPEHEAISLMERNRDEMLRLMRVIPEGYRVFVTSDSRRFLDFVSGADPRIYVTPGEIRNIDLSEDDNDDIWLKAFTDQQLLMDAARVHRMVTGDMYVSGYSRFAAEVGGTEFVDHRF